MKWITPVHGTAEIAEHGGVQVMEWIARNPEGFVNCGGTNVRWEE